MEKQKGQSLAEVLIALGAAILVVTALIVVTVGSLKNAQFAQNQSKATKYAQEAIDNVKSIRDRDGEMSFGGGSCVVGSIVNFSTLWSSNLSSPTSSLCGKRTSGTDCYFTLAIKDNKQILCEATTNNAETLEGVYKREIILRDIAPTGYLCNGLNCDFQHEKTLTVSVKWTDSAGEHQSKLETVLTPR